MTDRTPADLETFAESHGTTTAKLHTFIKEKMRQQLTPMWSELSYMKHECELCGHVVESKRGRGNTNFGRASHVKKHLNTGEAWTPWDPRYAGTDAYIMPTAAELEEAITKEKRDREIAKLLPALKEARKPYVTELKRMRKEREGYELSLQTAIRKYGPEASKVDVTFNSYATEVRSLTDQIEEHQTELRTVENQYDEDVVGKLTFGDGF